MHYQNLSHEDLVDLLIERKMKFDDVERAANKLKQISYYKIKEFALPLAKVTPQKDAPSLIDFRGIKFEEIITRYYRDKNFRQFILHALEDIEVALQAQIAYVLGQSNGDYGYLDFLKWSDTTNNSTRKIMSIENKIKKELSYQIDKTESAELKEKLQFGGNPDFPPIWLATDHLMFGDLVKILEIMSSKRIKKISNFFKCSVDELRSWMKCLNLIRNISAHNSNLIDIRIKTSPKIRKEWEVWLYKEQENLITNRISVPLIILIYLIKQINPRYRFNYIKKSINTICKNDNSTAKYYGFSNKTSVNEIFDKCR
ncbi:Abi family protein [Facklamia sp. P12955]|uniref:Abi family protein n=1 Tax=Facklamia sp. P12955 TaxID=3421946 RepID=UPI003D17F81E